MIFVIAGDAGSNDSAATANVFDVPHASSMTLLAFSVVQQEIDARYLSTLS